ncbi:MAG: uL15m family ribosomal protein [Candidatus Micrarchaeota archaeon]|nr:uL15m family ribosomal protein [Candidatus Micrarchaeota archaeon]
MTRRLKSRNRKYAGDRTYGGGNKKNRRGKGSRGGRGRAGYHKHKWMHTIKYELEALRFKHKGFAAQFKDMPAITLAHINKLLESGKVDKNNCHFAFPGMKVIGSFALVAKANISASAFSKGAKASIEKAGGTANLIEALVKKTPVAPTNAKPAKKA